ncbi:hypothetical protein [Acidiferrobacter sp.]|uniref:hypothetical protein n=1 Tax=Acidiferrobacter sp. TaxID=1872107 RepID=UPI00262D4F65|nr:hypothetical protein [Acidiferrobacter sp.]
MKILVGLLLFANLALGLWNYIYGPMRAHEPRLIHPQRLQVVPAQLAAAAGPAPKAPTALSPPAPVSPVSPQAHQAPAIATPTQPIASPVKTVRPTRPVSIRPPVPLPARQCWDLGPVKRRAAATALLRHIGLYGRVVSHPGAPAYRVYLPVGTPWPSVAMLHRLGVVGAYVTHGPAGGEVLSLGVFLQKKAALQQLHTFRAHSIAARIGAFGAPIHYYAQTHATLSAGLLKKLAGVGHRGCRSLP